MTKVANSFRFSDGFAVPTYKRIILLAHASHRECAIFPGSLLAIANIYPENLLLAMLPTIYLSIRELALPKILKARKESKCSILRELNLPQLNTEALHLYELIHWATEKVTEPPMTMKYDDRNYRYDFFG
ncbi:unnamed protein product [Brassicogethes aeneus]|uniref:Uncharacterized protein n=1 Tax=Brassicogethes aeneus TaxID=1431903 RepID=A0A9P0ASI6_BRAAE|nr:unnamed protein product [Brassicogethes aeneus]